MTTTEAELLLRSIGSLGDSFAQQKDRERQQSQFDARMDMERQNADRQEKERLATEDYRKSARDAAAAHYSKMEQGQANAADLAASKARMEWKQKLLQSALHSNATGQLDDGSRESFNKWLANDEDMKTTGLQLGKPSSLMAKPGAKESASVNVINSMNDFRSRAKASQDPEEQKELNHAADLLEGIATKMGTVKTPTPPMDTIRTETTIPKVPADSGSPALSESLLHKLSGGKFGTPATPAVAPTPEQPERKIYHTTKVPAIPIGVGSPAPSSPPIGTVGNLAAQTPTMTTDNMPDAPVNPQDRITGQVYKSPKGGKLPEGTLLKWNGSRWLPQQ